MLNFKSHIICITEKPEGVEQKLENNKLQDLHVAPAKRGAQVCVRQQRAAIKNHFSLRSTASLNFRNAAMHLRALICVSLALLIAGISVCSCNMKTLPQISLLQHTHTQQSREFLRNKTTHHHHRFNAPNHQQQQCEH